MSGIRVRRENFQSFTNSCCYSYELGCDDDRDMLIFLCLCWWVRSFHMSFAQSLARVCEFELVRTFWTLEGVPMILSLAFIYCLCNIQCINVVCPSVVVYEYFQVGKGIIFV